VIGGFYIGKRHCILHALGNKKDNLAEFNLADFRNSPNRQNKFYAKFSSYTVYCPLLIINYFNLMVVLSCSMAHWGLVIPWVSHPGSLTEA